MLPHSPQSTWAVFAWGEVQLEKRPLVMRTDALHVVFDDGASSLVTGLAQTLEYLLCEAGYEGGRTNEQFSP